MQVVIIRHAKTVQLYNIVEHGRRFYRSIIWSSNSDYCLHDMTRTLVAPKSGPSFVSGMCGYPDTSSHHPPARCKTI